MRTNPGAVAALQIAAVAIGIIAAPAPLAVSRDGSSRSGTEDGTDRGTTSATKRTTKNCAAGAAENRSAKHVLRGSLMQRRDDRKREQHGSTQAGGKGNPQASDHEQASVPGLLSDPVWPFLMQMKATSRQESPGRPGMDHAAARWLAVRSSMMLMSDRGETWRFEADDNAQWRLVPDSANPLIMLRQ